MNKKLEIGVNKLLLSQHDKNVVGVYIGNTTINNKDKQYLKDNSLILISPNLYKLSYYKTWITSDKTRYIEYYSLCCDAKPIGEIDNNSLTGFCSHCKDNACFRMVHK